MFHFSLLYSIRLFDPASFMTLPFKTLRPNFEMEMHYFKRRRHFVKNTYVHLLYDNAISAKDFSQTFYFYSDVRNLS